jgi:hypothetical protein
MGDNQMHYSLMVLFVFIFQLFNQVKYSLLTLLFILRVPSLDSACKAIFISVSEVNSIQVLTYYIVMFSIFYEQFW